MNTANGSQSGHVRVYHYNSDITSTWNQLNQDLVGEAADDQSGVRSSLSKDGKVLPVAIAAILK